jgi:hypothetical protein
MFKLPHVRSDPAEIVGNGDADAQDDEQEPRSVETAWLSLPAEAVAQTIACLDFLYVCNKVTILG